MKSIDIIYVQKPKDLTIIVATDGKVDELYFSDVDDAHFIRTADYPRGVPADKKELQKK